MTNDRRFNKWAGNPKGDPERKDDCIASVSDTAVWNSYQCCRKRGYGKDGLYCKQHAKKFKPTRNYEDEKEILMQKTFKKGEIYHTDEFYGVSIEKYFEKVSEGDPKEIEFSETEKCTKSIKITIEALRKKE